MNISGINAVQIGVVLMFTSGFPDAIHSPPTSVTPWAVILAPTFASMTKAITDFEVRSSSPFSNDDMTILEDRYELHRKG